MEIYRTACLVAKSNFMRWKKDGRILLTFLLMIVLMIRYFSGLSSFGIKYHTKITPFLLSVVFADCDITNGLLKILVCFGWVCLLCDVPVRDPFLTYIVLRSGRKGWRLGENIYICASAFGYTVFLSVIPALILLPSVSLHEFWGSTITQILKSDEYQVLYLGNLVLPRRVISIIYPYGAQILGFLAVWLQFWFLGMVMYSINFCCKSNTLGIAAAVFLILLDPVVVYCGASMTTKWMYRFSPVNWSSIENWTIVGQTQPVSMTYAYGMYAIMIGIGMFWTRWRCIKEDIRVDERL